MRLWKRPTLDDWSAGEHLSHAATVQRFFPRLNRLLWPVCVHFARTRLGESCEAEIDDVYARRIFRTRLDGGDRPSTQPTALRRWRT